MSMKKIALFICFTLVVIAAYSDKYVIEELNGDYIYYQNRKLFKGDSIAHPDSIIWNKSAATAVHVRNVRTGNKTRLRKSDNDKGKSSLFSYFFKTNHGSTRLCEDYSLSKVLRNVFLLEDTIRVHTDDPKIIDVYTKQSSNDVLKKYYLTYNYNDVTYTVAIPLEEDELIISKQLFDNIPVSHRILASVFSIDSLGQKNIISDSMIIVRLFDEK